MPPVGWGVVVVALVSLGPPAQADIYSFRDGSGTRVFSNAPPSPGHLVMRELRDVPPIPIVPAQPRPVHVGGYDGLIREIAARHGLEYALVKAIIKAESAFNRLAVSPKGALGLMQLMPGTAADNKVQNAFHPRENIEGGCRHLRMLLERYEGNVVLAVAAYNAGQGRVEAAGGIPDIPETREYLERVLRYRQGYLREDGARVALRR